MRISEKERTILACIEHQAEQSIKETQKQTGLRAHTISYSLNRLKTKGIILGKAPFINLYPLGLTDYTIYFSLPSNSKNSSQNFFDCLMNSPGVSWLAKLGGEFQVGIAICARRIEEVSKLLNEISKNFGNVFYQKSISVRVSFYAFGRKYLRSKSNSPNILRSGLFEYSDVEIGEIDHRILSGISNMEFTSQREAARKLGIPISTFQRKIQTLEASGIIEGYIYRLNFSKLNVQTYRFLIYARGINLSLTKRLYEFSKKHPQILHFIECLGAWDYEIGVEVEHSEDATNITQSLYEHFGSEFNSIKTLQIYRHMKYSSYPF